jgi:hypothetical protein
MSPAAFASFYPNLAQSDDGIQADAQVS